MFFTLTIILFYLAVVSPEHISWAVFTLAVSVNFFRKGWKRKLSHAFLSALMVLVFMAVSESAPVKTAIPLDRVSAITVRVASDSQLKKRRRSGFEGSMLYAEDRFGTYASASGKVYCLSDGTELWRGDEVTLRGNFSDDAGVFFTRDAVIRKRHGGHIMRSRVTDFLRRRMADLPEEVRELSMLLLLGSGDDPGFNLTADARKKGVSHVFALSGMHLSLLCSFLLPVLSLIFGKRGAEKAVLLPLLFFTYTSGWRPSLVRAFLYRAVHTFTEKESDICFALTVILHGLIFPDTLLSVGSVYSYLSVAALSFMVPMLDEAAERAIGIRLTAVTTSLACLIVTAPYSMLLFGEWSLSSLIFSPIVSLIVTIFMGLTLLFVLFPVFPSVISWMNAALTGVLSLGWGEFPQADLEIWFWMTLVSLFLIAASKVVKKENNLYAGA